MPNNFRLFHNNLVLGTAVAITVNSAELSLPGTNISNPNRRKVWQTVSGTTIGTAVIDLGAAYDVTGVGLVSSNLATTGTYIIQAHTSDSWGAPAYNSGVLNPYDDGGFTGLLLFYFTTKTYRYWRLILNNVGGADNFVKLGVAWIGTYATSERNFVYGWKMDTVDLSKVDYALDGTPYTDELGSYKTVDMEVKFLTEGWALTTLLPILKTVGGKKDVILAMMPERTASEGTTPEYYSNLYGRFVGRLGITNPTFQRFSGPLSFREST